ncbi:putative NADPH-quinone reductase [Algoriphagus sp. 4150]|uniref:NAD(P)H-dependent oxidoreductase n=1 Tax=Algoriphagus sp. 4150 TaxID=2817756 RepID=UPI00285E0B5A|nr:NAD(P)H-dependent oxidoreductase [Algoriphagus sp. 4150]MDR7131759.1 putative NADPH-quinone reductase [Algoriphagus sp. 4150]
MQILVIVVHPNLKQSVVHKRLIQELNKRPDKFKIHDLYASYPDEKIDVKREQELIESFDRVVFQFPIYWFNVPSFLKKWMDEVLTYNWAYGRSSGYKLGGKKVALAVSAGIDQESATGDYALEKIIHPLFLTFDYLRIVYQGHYPIYGVASNAIASTDGTFALERTVDDTTLAYVEEYVTDYMTFLENPEKHKTAETSDTYLSTL